MNPVATLSRRRFAAAGAVASTVAGTAASIVLVPNRLRGETPDLLDAAEAPARVSGGDDWIVHAEVPANREPPLPRLVQSWITPVDRFYVRSHAEVPRIDPATYRLRIGGMVQRPVDWTLQQLADRFEPVTITATMTCAGNRRTEHSRTRQIDGVPWQAGAIGNANWTGYRLADVLDHSGLRPATRHIWFDGLDQIDRGPRRDDGSGGVIGFGASIPIAKLRSDAEATILCTHMNGEPLTGDHGYPLRTVVPGYIGARSVKWLGRITASNRANPNHYQQTAYKVVTQTDPIDWAEAVAIYRFPINAVIADFQRSGFRRGGPSVANEKRGMVSGYALPPGDPGVTIRRIDVSVDDGGSWDSADLIGPSKPMCWQLWRCRLDVPDDARSLLVRAIDSRGRVQPESTPWNKKGYLYNAQHRMPLGD